MGDHGVGKSCLLNRYTKGEYKEESATLAAMFKLVHANVAFGLG